MMCIGESRLRVAIFLLLGAYIERKTAIPAGHCLTSELRDSWSSQESLVLQIILIGVPSRKYTSSHE